MDTLVNINTNNDSCSPFTAQLTACERWQQITLWNDSLDFDDADVSWKVNIRQIVWQLYISLKQHNASGKWDVLTWDK